MARGGSPKGSNPQFGGPIFQLSTNIAYEREDKWIEITMSSLKGFCMSFIWNHSFFLFGKNSWNDDQKYDRVSPTIFVIATMIYSKLCLDL